MTANGPRTPTIDESATRPRNAEAVAANRERGARTAAMELLKRVSSLSRQDLLTVTERLLDECETRGVRYLLEED